jgi:tetratricopeptide (TPR) repeat protein
MARAAERFAAAEQGWGEALSIVGANPDAAGPDMRGRLQDGVERVRRRRAEVARLQQVLIDRQKFAERRQRFEPHRDQVLFRAVSFREQDTAADADVIRKEAPAALAQFGLDAADPKALAAGLDPFRAVVEGPELTRAAAECIEVLLTWAGAEATAPGPEGGPRQALRLIAAAEALGQAHGLATLRALHRRRAQCLDLLADPAGAQAERDRAAAIDPTTALDFFEAGLEDYLAERWPEASAACQAALDRQSDHFWAQYVKALCNLREQRWGEAKVGLDVCWRRHPEYPWLLPLRGIAHGGLKEYEAAEKDFERALKASDDPAFQAATLTSRSSLRLLQPGRRADAESDLRQAIKLQPNVYQGYVNLSRVLEGRKDLAGAVEQLDTALKLRPKSSVLYFRRARLHAGLGDRDAARQDFVKVVDNEPPASGSNYVAAARVELAHLRLQDAARVPAEQAAAEYRKALADCNAVIDVRPDFTDAYRQRAEVRLALKENKAAADDLDRYLTMDLHPTPAVWRARGLLHAEDKKPDKAVEAYTQALSLTKKGDASIPDILSDRGWAYLAQLAAQPALTDFDAALKLKPDHTESLAGKGTALVLRGRPEDVDEATALADKSLKPGPRTVSRLLAGARVYSRASAVLEAAPRRPANDPQVERYQQQALALLSEALRQVPAKERPAVVDALLKDPALLPLQRNPGLRALAGAYGR